MTCNFWLFILFPCSRLLVLDLYTCMVSKQRELHPMAKDQLFSNNFYITYALKTPNIFLRDKVCVWIARLHIHVFSFCVFLFFFFSFFSKPQLLTKSSVNSASVHCLRTHKLYFSVTFSLKMGLITLFTHLKIISLQCFQFQFSVSAKISSIQTDSKEIYLITLLYIVVIGLRLVGGYNL